jgi:tetratricopeptide (TPR) repeat protein
MHTHIWIVSLSLFGAPLLLPGCSEPGQTEIARGNVLASQRKFDQALESYRSAVRAAPGRAHPRELLGHLLFDLGRTAEARLAYQEAIEADPGTALEARIGLARADAEESKYDQALKRLDSVLNTQPNNLYALLSRASIALRRSRPGDAQSAIADTAKAMLVDSKNASVLYLRGSSFVAAGELDQAAASFRRLEDTHPSLPLAWYGYARLASARGDRSAALSNLAKAREKALKLPGGWNGGEVLADPGLRSLRNDPEFTALIRTQ